MTEKKVTAANLIEQIRVSFPELEESYQEQAEDLEGANGLPSNYLFAGLVLQPRIEQEIASGKTTDLLRRCANFIERVCIDDDPEVVNVIWVRIFEWLIFRPRELKTIWPLLGPATKANIRDAAHRWSEAGRFHGKTQNLPDDNIPES